MKYTVALFYGNANKKRKVKNARVKKHRVSE